MLAGYDSYLRRTVNSTENVKEGWIEKGMMTDWTDRRISLKLRPVAAG
jgi:hypothetical protein